MENLTIGVALFIGVVILVFLWQIVRSVWYWTASKMFGWSKEEKFERETAWLDRAVARDARIAKKDARASSDSPRKWLGVNFVTLAFASLALQLNVPWWQSGLAVILFLSGLVMAAGLAWRMY
jgi:hypothetical protein